MKEYDESLSELRTLLARLCDGELDAIGYRRVEEIVRGNPDARQLYIDYVLLQGELYWAGGRTSAPEPAKVQAELAGTTILAAARPMPLSRHSRRWPLIGSALAAGLVVVAMLLNRGDDVSKVADNDVIAPVKPAAIARLRSGDGCVWAGAQPKIADGTELFAGQRMELTEGVARFSFAKGATVLVESPAKFQLVSETSLRLDRGNVAVRASGPVKEFVVVSPDASIIDLGTSFAVHCDENGATEVEVLEGAVEVVSGDSSQNKRLLEMGESVGIDRKGKQVSFVATRPDEDRFAKLIEYLWNDIRAAAPDGVDLANAHSVEANFGDGATPDKVDTFYGATPGLGWLTPWVAAGNPTGRIRSDDPGFELGNPYLNLRFKQASERAIAREYGARPGFDPNEPHLITWRWRLWGNPAHFGGSFNDRAAFFGNPYFRRNTWPTNSWLIGIAGGDEKPGARDSSTKWLKQKRGANASSDPSFDTPRRVFPRRWYFFDNKSNDLAGAVFDRRNMVDTGMTLKPGVVYRFAVAVYPQDARYDAAIRDDERTVVRTGLSFRSRDSAPANVLHFAVSTDQPSDRLGFSLDSIHIHPLAGSGVRQQLENKGEEKQGTGD